MQESGEPYDQDWGLLMDDDFEPNPMFHHQLTDSEINSFLDLDEFMESSSPEMEFTGSCLAESRAENSGFDVAQINICSGPPPSSSFPYFIIPPGISPDELLESPAMLPNSLPSPTTGTFPLASCNHEHLTVKQIGVSVTDEDKDSAKFECPSGTTTQMPCVSSAENQALQCSESPSRSRKFEASIKSCDMSKSTNAVNLTLNATDIYIKPSNGGVADPQMPQVRECTEKEIVAQHPPGEDQKGEGVSTAGVTRNAEDGYCWRKYGQKHVKGSEYPRSYYKCNNSNCSVKKKVERSHDGEITEIIYTGAHNHPKPQPRLSLGRQASTGELLETSEGIGGPFPKVEGGAGWRYNQLNNKDIKVNSHWKAYGLKRTYSTSILNEIADKISVCPGKSSGSVFGSAENPDQIGSTIPNHEGEDEERATQGSTSPSDDAANGDEPEPKRRKKEIFTAEAYLPSRSSREPRVILQFESEIDVLDDGYRWRKYGQKVVKGNPNPRSYYKCTSAGCPVRKHVERASEDIKSVITTYEGKHNHEVPTAKNNGITTLGNSSPNVSDPHSILQALPKNHNVSNPEIQVQDFSLHYHQMQPNDFSQPNLLGDIVSDIELGASSIYPVKFPPLRSTVPYNPFVINTSNRTETHTSCMAAPVMTQFPVTVPMDLPRSANVAVTVSSGFHSSNHSRICTGSVQPSVGNQTTNRTETHRSCMAAPVMTQFPVTVPMDLPRSADVSVSSGFHSSNHSRIRTGSVQPSVGNQTTNRTETHTSCMAAPVMTQFPVTVPMDLPRSANVAVTVCSDFHSSNHSRICTGSVQPSVGNQTTNRTETHTSCMAAPVMTQFPVTVPMDLPRSANVAVTVSSDFHSSNHSRICTGSVQPSVGNQQYDSRFFMPKEQQKDDDHFYDSFLATPPDNPNATSSSVFCRAVGNFPN